MSKKYGFMKLCFFIIAIFSIHSEAYSSARAPRERGPKNAGKALLVESREWAAKIMSSNVVKADLMKLDGEQKHLATVKLHSLFYRLLKQRLKHQDGKTAAAQVQELYKQGAEMSPEAKRALLEQLDAPIVGEPVVGDFFGFSREYLESTMCGLHDGTSPCEFRKLVRTTSSGNETVLLYARQAVAALSHCPTDEDLDGFFIEMVQHGLGQTLMGFENTTGGNSGLVRSSITGDLSIAWGGVFAPNEPGVTGDVPAPYLHPDVYWSTQCRTRQASAASFESSPVTSLLLVTTVAAYWLGKK